MSAFDADPGVRPSFRSFVNYAATWEPIPDDGLAALRRGPAPTADLTAGFRANACVVAEFRTGLPRVALRLTGGANLIKSINMLVLSMRDRRTGAQRVDVHQHMWTEPLVSALAARGTLPFIRRSSGLTVLHAAGERSYVIDMESEAPITPRPVAAQRWPRSGADRDLKPDRDRGALS